MDVGSRPELVATRDWTGFSAKSCEVEIHHFDDREFDDPRNNSGRHHQKDTLPTLEVRVGIGVSTIGWSCGSMSETSTKGRIMKFSSWE
jgi:hypothetical protein